MAGRLTMWGAGELILSFFSQTTKPPSSFYLALIRTTPPNQYVSGGELDEPDNADYGRVEIPNDGLTWNNSSQPQIAVCDIDVLYAQAVTDWGTLLYWALTDSITDGNCYFVGDLEDPLSVVAGDTPMIGAGDLNVSLGPFFLVDEDD